MTKLEQYANELGQTTAELKEVSEEYAELMEKVERVKIEKLDFSVRDSIEKQTMRLLQEDEEFKEMWLRAEKLRRKRDTLKYEVSVLRTLVQASTSMLV